MQGLDKVMGDRGRYFGIGKGRKLISVTSLRGAWYWGRRKRRGWGVGQKGEGGQKTKYS